jgi:hypothetical protein
MKTTIMIGAAIAALVTALPEASANLNAECESRFEIRNDENGQPVFRTEVTCQSGGGGSSGGYGSGDDFWWDWMIGGNEAPPPPDGGGGGGGDPMSDARTKLLINRTIAIAAQRMRDIPACAFLMRGSAGEGIDVLNALVTAGRIRSGGILDIISERPHPDTAARVSGLGEGRSGSIWLFGPFFGTNLMPDGLAIYNDDERARVLLHELGHLTANPGCSPVPTCIPSLDPYRHTDDPATEAEYDDRIRADCRL